jgi:Kef-type K+ transport system membrane component KefB
MSRSDPAPPLRAALNYLLMLVAAGLLFWWILRSGVALERPLAGSAAPAAAADHTLLHLLLALAAVIALGRLLGALFRYIGQPPVIGEVVAGLMLGPSLLGWVWPAAGGWLLPPGVAPFLGAIAQLGVVLYMFQIGLELNHTALRGRGRIVVAVSHASIVVPFLLGAALALWLYPRFAPASVGFTAFALFMGVAMAITAFPVLARILGDSGLQHTPVGAMALACAAVDDVTAWCLLAGVVAVVQAQPGNALGVVALALGFIAAMVWLVRPWLVRLSARAPDQGTAGLVLLLVLLAAVATEGIGIHAVFGAFLLGALIPHDSALARGFEGKLKEVVATLLLPAFFAYTGMRTELNLLQGFDQWLVCAAIVVVATFGKFGGAALAARCGGLPWREASALGVLLNTRGLVELIVLNIGLDLGVISRELFAMMVLMALATTLATAPALRLCMPELRTARRRPSPPAPHP